MRVAYDTPAERLRAIPALLERIVARTAVRPLRALPPDDDRRMGAAVRTVLFPPQEPDSHPLLDLQHAVNCRIIEEFARARASSSRCSARSASLVRLAACAPMFHVVLFEPEIPPNTGNAIRLCANTGARLHLVHPLGFRLDDRSLQRSGLDYHDLADVQRARGPRRVPRGARRSAPVRGRNRRRAPLHRRALRDGDAFLFGPETRGLPGAVLEADRPRALACRIPMRKPSRSLNLVERGGAGRLRGLAAAAASDGLGHSVSERMSRPISACTAARAPGGPRTGPGRPRCKSASRRRRVAATSCTARAAGTPSTTWSMLRSAASRAMLTAADREPEAAVARLVVGAGQHQIAEPGQTHEGLALRAEPDAEAHHLREPARDQRDARVGAEAQAVGDAGADRDDVLDGAADFHADDVGLRVGAKIRARRGACARSPANSSSREAMVIAVGSPAPTSRANVGPDSTATGRGPENLRARPGAAAGRYSPRSPWWPRRCALRGAAAGAISARVARNACEGTTTSTSRAVRRAPRRDRGSHGSACRELARPADSARCAARRAWPRAAPDPAPTATSAWPARAIWIASAVPQEPAPMHRHRLWAPGLHRPC